MNSLNVLIERLATRKTTALTKLAFDLHKTSQDNGSIPYDTGYLSNESGSVTTVGDKVKIAYNTDYAEYVWKQNKTGKPEWTLKDFEENKNELLRQFYEDLMHG